MSDYFSEGGQQVRDITDLPTSAADRIDQGNWGHFNSYSNDKFIYPGSMVRKNPAGETYVVKRGFMRQLQPSHGEGPPLTQGAAGSARLFFQFNPETIQRSVQGRDDIHSFLTATPYDLTTPINGTSNFTLNLLFNREAEVAAATQKTASLDLLRSDSANLAGNAGQIGVLADIFVMDSIIGQGENANTIEQLVDRAQYLQQHAPADGAVDESTGTTVPPAPVAGDPEDPTARFETLFLGNSAYLLPRPVRIIFSDLFMVDGFVQTSTVDLVKFSRRMVPTIAAVGLQIEAQYIGFHREVTALTANWNKPFQVSVGGGAFGSGTTTAETATPNGDPVHSALIARMGRNGGGFFNRFEHRGTSDTSFTDFEPVSGSSPLVVERNFALSFWYPEDRRQEIHEWSSERSIEVQSVVEAVSFEVESAGRWASGGSVSVEPTITSTSSITVSGGTVHGSAGGRKSDPQHKIKIVPNTRSLSQRLVASYKYRLTLNVYYRVRAGSGEWIRSTKRQVQITKLGSENWNLPSYTIALPQGTGLPDVR